MDTTTYTRKEVGRRLRALAAKRGMDAGFIAGRARLRTQDVKAYLAGETEPAATRFLALLDALVCTEADFRSVPPDGEGEA